MLFECERNLFLKVIFNGSPLLEHHTSNTKHQTSYIIHTNSIYSSFPGISEPPPSIFHPTGEFKIQSFSVDIRDLSILSFFDVVEI